MISVALCTCNGENFIKEQLLSIINQTKKVDEIIICDDCSEDSTITIIEEILKKEFDNYKLLVNKTRIGVAKNFEKAISACTGNIIFLSDQDDIWENNKVQMVTDFFSNNKNCNMIFTDAKLINANGDFLGSSLWKNLCFSPKEEYCLFDFLGKRFVTGATVAIKREFARNCFPIPESWLHDAWLAINSSIDKSISSINVPLIQYRQHSKNVVGANRNIIKRILNRINHIKDGINYKTKRLNQLKTFCDLNKKKISNEYEEALLIAIAFWEDMNKLITCSRKEGFSIITRNLIKGNYKRFYNGFSSVLFDIFLVIKREQR